MAGLIVEGPGWPPGLSTLRDRALLELLKGLGAPYSGEARRGSNGGEWVWPVSPPSSQKKSPNREVEQTDSHYDNYEEE